MNEKLLTPEQRKHIEELAAAGEQVLARRAAILLAYDDGSGTEQIALTLNISARLARYWRHAFVETGMSIFHEAEPLTTRAAMNDTQGRSRLSSILANPTPPKKAGLLADDSMQTAGRKIMRFQLAHMLSHEENTRLGEDIEALHDMRVASRRLRVALEIFQPFFPAKKIRTHRRNMRDVGRALGCVRDLDVFIEKTQTYIETLPADESASMQPLMNAFTNQRQQAQAALLAVLDAAETRQFLTDFDDFLNRADEGDAGTDAQPQPSKVSHFTPIFIYQRLAAVRAFEDILEHASLEQLHALRSAFKYLRYTIEFFREVLGDEVKNVLNDLKSIQEHLGNLNDAHVACGLLNEFLADWEAQQNLLPILGRENPQGILTCLSQRSQERHRLMTEFPQVWQSFNRPEFRVAVASMIAAL